MSNRQMKKGVNIQVLLRCRPYSDDELRNNVPQVVTCDDYQVGVSHNSAGKQIHRLFTFDKVFGPAAQQKDLYDQAVVPIVNEVLEGYNCTIFAYGQTGTGKTFTMEGEWKSENGASEQLPPEAGVIPRAVKQIFDTLQSQSVEYSVKVTFLELYNEEITDLLAHEEKTRVSVEEKQKKNITLMDDGKGGNVVTGLEEEIVKNTSEILTLLERGSAKRRTAETLLNKQSSRSHSVFSMTVHTKQTKPEGEEQISCGKLNLVDLAGSENISRSGAAKDCAREAGSINTSLLALGRVITALDQHNKYIPYRASNLTRLLSDSLGGRTKTCIIATVSPVVDCLEETLSTLDYAHRAKNIKNMPEVNQEMVKKTVKKDLEGEIAQLKKELFATREMYNQERKKTDELQEKYDAQVQQVSDLKCKLDTQNILDLQQQHITWTPKNNNSSSSSNGSSRLPKPLFDQWKPSQRVLLLKPEQIEEVRLRLNVEVTAESSAPIPAPIESFTDMCLHKSIMEEIIFHEFARLTPIQAQAMPIALKGRDLLGFAETGSGKTAAFAIPMIQHCLAQPRVQHVDGPLALVLAPTRELAQQIEKEIKVFSRSLESFRIAIAADGTNIEEERSELREGVNIVVATPGKFIDHLLQGNTCLLRISFVVLDDVDKMLAMGFEPQIRQVLRNLPSKHQTLLFSTTMPVEIEALKQEYLTDPVHIKVGKVSTATEYVSQMLQKVLENETTLAHPGGSTNINLGEIEQRALADRPPIDTGQDMEGCQILSISGKQGLTHPSSTAIDIDIGEERRYDLRKRARTSESLFSNSTVDDHEAPSVCCSCHYNSQCKTKKCKCQAAGGACGASCGCVPTKCTNRNPGCACSTRSECMTCSCPTNGCTLKCQCGLIKCLNIDDYM